MKNILKISFLLLLNASLTDVAFGAKCTDTQIRSYGKSCETIEAGYDTSKSKTYYTCCKSDMILKSALVDTGIRYSYWDDWDGRVNGTYDIQLYHCEEQCPKDGVTQ